MSISSNLLNWICGFNSRRDSYPAPWSTLSTFGADRKVKGVSGAFSGSVIGKTVVRAVNAILSGTAFISMTDDEDILVELPRDNGDMKVVAYMSRANMIKACIASPTTKDTAEMLGPFSFAPMATTAASGDAVALCAILIQAVHAKAANLPKQAMSEMADAGFTPEKPDAFLSQFTSIAGFLYEGLKGGNPTKGVPAFPIRDIPLDGASGNDLPFLSEEDIKRLARRMNSALAATKMPYLSMSAAAPLFFRTAGTVAETAETVEEHKTDLAELKERLALPIHPLTSEEQAMVVNLPETYVIPDKLVEVAQTIKDDWHFPGVDLAPNIILEGDSGSGKTAGTKFLSAVFGIPRTKMTMQPMMESANLIGAFYPVFTDIDGWDLDEKEKEAIKEIQQAAVESLRVKERVPKKEDTLSLLRWGLSCPAVREKIRIHYDIPTEEEIEFDPESAWTRLGHDGEDIPNEREIQSEAKSKFEDAAFRVLAIMSEHAEQNTSMSYRFIHSELIRAFQNGWLLEIQEAASVLRPGVLNELNDILEPGGRIELPNGEFIYRHPDTIVVITTNRDYAGNVDLNESLRDRCVLGVKMDLPPVEVMAARAMAQTGYTERTNAVIAAKAVTAVAEVARSRNIRGSFGMRSLIAWMLDLRRGDYSTEKFMNRVIFKMTTRDEDVNILKKAYEENCAFATSYPSGVRRKR